MLRRTREYNSTKQIDRAKMTEVPSGSRCAQSEKRLMDMLRENKRLERLDERLWNMKSERRRKPYALSEDEWEDYKASLNRLRTLGPGSEYNQIEGALLRYDIDISETSSSGTETYTVTQNRHNESVERCKQPVTPRPPAMRLPELEMPKPKKKKWKKKYTPSISTESSDILGGF
jgi:hypothetical protein